MTDCMNVVEIILAKNGLIRACLTLYLLILNLFVLLTIEEYYLYSSSSLYSCSLSKFITKT